MNTLKLTLFTVLAALLPLCLCASARAGTTFNVVTQYGADNTGVNDSTTAIQNAVNAAIGAGSGNTVLLPAGTYLLGNGPINIVNSSGLTFTGASAASTASTMIWFTRANGNVLNAYGNTNFTVQNFSADVQKLPATGLYDLGISQGTITAVNAATNQVTVQVESGYPLMNRSDLASAATLNGWSKVLWTVSDPTRLDFDGNAPTITAVAPSANGTTAVLTLQSFGYKLFVGERWLIFLSEGGGLINIGYGNAGATLIQNVNYYGGGMGGMGIACHHTGTLTFNNLYCGPPPYQSDRLLTSGGGWAMSTENRAAINITNSTLLQIWDDVFDVGCSETGTVWPQPASNQVLVQNSNNGDYQQGDAVEFIDDTDSPVGATYGQCTIAQPPTMQNGNVLVTLSQNVTLHNAGKDYFTDLTQAGPVTATNDTFNSAAGRHVYFRSGVSVTVTGCTFVDNTPLVTAGWDDSEGPSEVHNQTITGNTFLNSAGLIINANGGATQAATGSNVTVSGNTFYNCGRYGEQDSTPLTVSNVNGATVKDNWFTNNWGANADFQYDTNLSATGNTFLYPNQIQGSQTGDNSVIYLANVSNSALNGNLVYGLGPDTLFLTQTGANVSGVTGLPDGTIDLDNPLANYLSFDQIVMDAPPTSSTVDQAVWKASKNQQWTALPAQSAPGSFTMYDTANGQYVGNGTSKASSAGIVLENQSWTSGAPSAEQLWNFGYIDDNDNNIVNDYSGFAINDVGESKTAGQALCQWYSGNSINQNFYVVAPPAATVSQQFGGVTISWNPVAYATSYSVGRSTTSGGPYTTLASNLAAGPYVDTSGVTGTVYYYVVTAAGLPVSNNESNQVWAVPGASYAPVNIASATNVTGIEPDGWNYQGAGLDTYGYTYSSTLTGSYITWNGDLFTLGSPAKPDVVGDIGQTITYPNGASTVVAPRVLLPGGTYSNLLILAGYLGANGPSGVGTFQPTITYTDGSIQALSQAMTNWCGSASQSGESNAATYSYRNENNGTKQSVSCYIHGYSIPINSSKSAWYLTLPNTGQFRILAMDMGGMNRSALSTGQYLLAGQYLVSPNGNYILVQQTDGNLVLYNGSNPQHEGSALWASGYYSTSGNYFTVLQPDGNLVTYTGTPSDHAKDSTLRSVGFEHGWQFDGHKPAAHQHTGDAAIGGNHRVLSEAVTISTPPGRSSQGEPSGGFFVNSLACAHAPSRSFGLFMSWAIVFGFRL